MEINKFKVGDKVKISPDSKYYGINNNTNPSDKVGEVIELNSGFLPISVSWGNFNSNAYGETDLELASPQIYKTKDQLLAQIAELQKQVEEIDKKENEKYFKITDFNFIHLNTHSAKHGNFSGKAYILSEDHNWEIIRDSNGNLVLVPTKKQ